MECLNIWNIHSNVHENRWSHVRWFHIAIRGALKIQEVLEISKLGHFGQFWVPHCSAFAFSFFFGATFFCSITDHHSRQPLATGHESFSTSSLLVRWYTQCTGSNVIGLVPLGKISSTFSRRDYLTRTGHTALFASYFEFIMETFDLTMPISEHYSERQGINS